MVEQVLGLERLADEYDTVAKEEISYITKLSVLLKVVTPALRQHLQLSMDESATCASTREEIINYERTTTSWNSATVYREVDIKDKHQHDEALPMEVDRAKGFPRAKARRASKARALERMAQARTKAKEMESRKGRALTTTRARIIKAMAKPMERAKVDWRTLHASYVANVDTGAEGALSGHSDRLHKKVKLLRLDLLWSGRRL